VYRQCTLSTLCMHAYVNFALSLARHAVALARTVSSEVRSVQRLPFVACGLPYRVESRTRHRHTVNGVVYSLRSTVSWLRQGHSITGPHLSSSLVTGGFRYRCHLGTSVVFCRQTIVRLLLCRWARMCGIFGLYSYKAPRTRRAALNTLLNGLRQLEYRG
jgi:hypothetical protein